MERIGNVYCWDCLNDWIMAQKTGMIHIIESECCGEEMFRWEQLIDMIYEDCFPQCLLCFRRKAKNYLVLTKEQKKVFEFLKDKIVLRRQNDSCGLFSDYPIEFRNRVLNARIDSIWIRLEEEHCLFSQESF